MDNYIQNRYDVSKFDLDDHIDWFVDDDGEEYSAYCADTIKGWISKSRKEAYDNGFIEGYGASRSAKTSLPERFENQIKMLQHEFSVARVKWDAEKQAYDRVVSDLRKRVIQDKNKANRADARANELTLQNAELMRLNEAHTHKDYAELTQHVKNLESMVERLKYENHNLKKANENGSDVLSEIVDLLKNKGHC